MRHFIKLIETLRQDGILSPEFKQYADGRSEKTSGAGFAPPLQEVWGQIEKCQPFVFSDSEPITIEIDSNTQENFDPPFPVFSIEALSGPLHINEYPNAGRITCWCMMVVEIAPKQYKYMALMEGPHGKLMVTRPDKHMAPVIEHYLNRLGREKMGMETVRQTVKVGSGGSKRLHRIRRVIHVAPKKFGFPSSGNRLVDWSHRWTVRGHWVSLQGKLGKDRDGNYCIKDWTWRSEHIKGPETAPLITKVRIVE
jgi:hypothetical protein